MKVVNNSHVGEPGAENGILGRLVEPRKTIKVCRNYQDSVRYCASTRPLDDKMAHPDAKAKRAYFSNGISEGTRSCSGGANGLIRAIRFGEPGAISRRGARGFWCQAGRGVSETRHRVKRTEEVR
jgi:hypothetical protein